MIPRHSPYPPFSSTPMSLSFCGKGSMNSMEEHCFVNEKALFEGSLLENPCLIYRYKFLRRCIFKSYQKGRRFLSGLRRLTAFNESCMQTADIDALSLKYSKPRPLVLHQYERFHPPTKPKFSNRESDPPGDPPWSNTLSNNSKPRIVPFTNRLADDPIGKEAERETKIIRRYQICH